MKNVLRISVTLGCILSLAICAQGAAKKPTGSCRPCHADLKSQLGPTHPAVTKDTIAACLPCHNATGKAAKHSSAFSTRIHAPHVTATSGVTCELCHVIVPDKRFTVRGSAKNLGKPTADDVTLDREIMASLDTGKFLAAAHVKNQVSCSGCHGAALPVKGDAVENDRCLACHGSYEALAEKTKPKEPHGPNPHKSHLGAIACTACHYGHQKAVLYCKDCHPKFTMKIPFGE